MGVNGVNQQLSTVIERTALLRTGIVTQVDPFGVTVEVGENAMRAAYARQSEPEPGDTVVVLRQGASWFVIGTSSATGGNLVYNGSFEELDINATPVGWTLTNATNVMTALARADALAVEGSNVVDLFNSGAAAAVSRYYSRPFGVTVGQQLELSAYLNGLYPEGDPNTVDVQLQALWFANATDLYPTTSAADSTAATMNNITEADLMQVIRGTVTVPAGAVFARIGLRTAADPNVGATYDFVTARVV